MTALSRVRVPVATVWTSPRAPRDLDAPATADDPSVGAWLDILTPAGRLGLHGRTLTQLLEGEPVRVVAEEEDWSRIAAPWQPTATGTGYDGWVRSGHLRAADDEPGAPAAVIPADRIAITAYAERFLGLTYLWGGTSPAGFDCSGLVHYCHRQAGVVVPRDSPDQASVATPVPLGQEEPGDLYFFAAEDGRVYHIGFVTAAGRMLHAPEDDGSGVIVDEVVPPHRRAHLVGAGRLLL